MRVQKTLRAVEAIVTIIVVTAIAIAIGTSRLPRVETPVAAGAVGSVGGVDPVKDDPATPSPATPSLVPGSCTQVRWHYDRANTTAKAAAGASSAVVVARVRSVGPAQWATSDGQQPSGTLSAFAVFRVALVDVTDVGRGPVAKGATIAVRFPGGLIVTPNGPTSCASISVEGDPDFAPGSDVALFLNDGGTVQKGATMGADFDTRQAWRVESDAVIGPDSTTVSKSAFLVEAAP